MKKRVAGIVPVLLGLFCCLPAVAQNAAQQAALARLGFQRIGASPMNAQPNGVEASTVPLLAPYQLAFDSAGNLYIADSGDNLIREVSVTGVISTVAGSGAQGFSGDGGAATSAQLDTPQGIAVDASGNLYIADTNNQRIRKVSGGTITTIAGTGVAGFSGDGGAATSARLANPTALAVDSSGNVYIADTNNERIRKIAGTTITTVVGNGVEGFSGDGGLATAAELDQPTGLAVDSSGNLYIGDTNNQRVRKVTASTGNIATIAGNGTKGFSGDGTAVSVALASPSGVAVDASGNVFVADADNNRIREISGTTLTTIAGLGAQGYSGDTGAATGAQLDTPRAVLPGSGFVLLSDTNNNIVREIIAGNIVSSSGVPTAGSESLIVGGALTNVYGTGTLTAAFANGGATGTGQVSFYDRQSGSPVLIGQGTLSSNATSISTSTLAAGTHTIVASYAGDAHNNPINSGLFVYVLTPAPLTAVANTVNLYYGQSIPTLTGTLNGVLAQDTGKVAAVYATTATSTSNPGTYPITISLSGTAAGNYTVTPGTGSGSVLIAASPTTTVLTSSSATPIQGTNVTLTATITSTGGATPVGTVDFYDGATKLNTSPVTVNGSGVAALVTNALPVGSQSLKAVYSGNIDFVGSTSSTVTVSVLSPDFTVTASPASQSVLPLHSVDYTLTLTPVNPTFVYPVTLTASGLPAGVTATFAPASVATGAGASAVKMTLAASGQARLDKPVMPLGRWPAGTALALLLLPLAFGKRARRTAARLSRAGRVLLALLALAVIGSMAGCGGGGFFSHSSVNYTVTVTAVSGPITHTADVTLTVQ